MSKTLVLALGLTVLALARGDLPFPTEKELIESPEHHNFRQDVSRSDEEVYRLPTNVVPVEYDIHLDLYLAEREDRPYSYDGAVDIVIQAVEENVTQIVLHANVDSITTLSLLRDGLAHLLNSANPTELEAQYHFLKVNLAEPLEVGVNYTLSIAYSSTMNEGPMKRGIFKGWYIDDNGVERIYATTHFQPYNARQAFPCWDEPGFKAVFRLHLSRPYTYWGTFSNTHVESVELRENNRVVDIFFPTPRMSSYLVTFLVSETFTVIAEDQSFSPPIRIIGRSSAKSLGDHALELATEITQHFDEYFGITYASLHPSISNDHVASPDWASAGTENWGMVSYRELYLALDKSQTIMSVEKYAATLVSHEIVHMWFGNLITCYWWSNTWINEGYASYFGYIGAHAKFPKYDLHEHFNSRYLQNTLSYDSSASSEPMNYPVNTPAQVTAHFGTISYQKGASFLRQTVNIISEPTFRKSCNFFLVDNAYQPTDQYDLLRAFERAIQEDNALSAYSNFNFSDYYRIWVNEPGYPILTVEVDYANNEINLQQERYFISATATPTGQIYLIPITYSTRSNPNFDPSAAFIMTTETHTIQQNVNEEWIIFNNLQHGIYRVDYDQRTWSLIAEALLNEPESIHHMNRAQIVDDVFSLMRSERMAYGFGFQILRFLKNELNYHVWSPAITGFNWIRNRLRHLPESQAEYDAFLLSYLENVIEHYGFETSLSETPTEVETREIILHFACTLGHERCIRESRVRFDAFKNNHNVWINTGIRRNVYVVGVREGDGTDFDFLVELGNSTNYATDLMEIYRALGATKDSTLLTRYLELTLTNFVRYHDKANSFSFALLGNPENGVTVFEFVKNNIDRIREQYVEDSPARPVQTCLSNLASYLDEDKLQEYEDWLHTTQSTSAQYSTSLSAIQSARNNIAWGQSMADTILDATRSSATKFFTSLTLLFAMVFSMSMLKI